MSMTDSNSSQPVYLMNSSPDLPPAFASYAEEELAQAQAFGPGKHGICRATFARKPTEDTRLVDEYTKVPFHLSGTLDSDPGSGFTTLCLQDPTGGVLQGDRHEIDITALEDSRVHLTTQSATKVQSMHTNFAHLETKMTAKSGSYVEYFPGPTLLNENARCLQTASIDIQGDGVVLISDVFSPDGLTTHEPFGFDHYLSRIRARVDDILVCNDTVELQPEDGRPDNQAVLAEFQCIGSLYVFAPSQPAEKLADHIYSQVIEPSHSLKSHSDDDDSGTRQPTSIGVSTLPHSAGITIRILGHRVTDIHQTLQACWKVLRETILNEPIPKDRRY